MTVHTTLHTTNVVIQDLPLQPRAYDQHFLIDNQVQVLKPGARDPFRVLSLALDSNDRLEASVRRLEASVRRYETALKAVLTGG